MPRGAKRVLLIAGLSSLPSVSQRRDVWAEQKKEVNVVSGAPEKTKGENGQRFHVEYTTTGTKRTAIPMGTNKKEKKRDSGTHHFDLDGAVTFARLCEHVTSALTEIP